MLEWDSVSEVAWQAVLTRARPAIQAATTGRTIDEVAREMQVHDSLIDLVGNTPLLRLRKVTRGLRGPDADPETGPAVLAKVEYFNPGGSVKDRIALRMVEAAERSDELRPGGTIVEPTSGNTGVGLAIVAAEKGYHCLFVCPDKGARTR